MKNIGVIGCGAMGKGIVKNLIKNGYKVYAYDPSQDALAKCEALGAIPQPSPFEAASQADLIISSLPGPSIVKDVMMGGSGVFSALKPHSFVLDMSTIDPKTAQELNQAAKVNAIHFYDCPLSGGPKGADAGTLTIMVGGTINSCRTFDRSWRALEKIFFCSVLQDLARWRSCATICWLL